MDDVLKASEEELGWVCGERNDRVREREREKDTETVEN